jgi:hypothetical protein
VLDMGLHDVLKAGCASILDKSNVLTLVDLYDVSEVACVPSVGKFNILIL